MRRMKFDNYRIRADTHGKQYLLFTGVQESPFHSAVPFLKVYPLPRQDNPNVYLSATFLLPPLAGPKETLSMRAGPRNAVPRKSSPFETSHALLALELSFRVWFITHLSTILCPEVTQQTPSDLPLIFPWEVWGPQNTRAMHTHYREFNTVLLGSRMLLNNRLLDFDKQRTSKAQQQDLPSSVRVVDHQEDLRCPLFAGGNVTTSLPYVETTVDITGSEGTNMAFFSDIIECLDGPRVSLVFA